MMRKLASIQKVWKLEPIEGADKIELAHVLGWQCVVTKGQFNEGDLGVYFEIDSFLPVRDEFEFLRSSSYKKSDLLGEGFKLSTKKFRGQISQGLIIPVSSLLSYPEMFEVGDDVTDLLGVRKWEIEHKATTGGTIIGELPYLVKKTDETRIQSCPELIEEFGECDYYITTKIDGSSHSVSIDTDGYFHVMGHNYEYADDGKSSFYEYVKSNDIEMKMRKVMQHEGFKSMTIQGEWAGPGIQKNKLNLKKPEWFVFTIDVNRQRQGLKIMQEVVADMDLKMVPVEEVGENFSSKYNDVTSLLERAKGKYECGNKKEGIVVRPVVPKYSKVLDGCLSMKVINNEYLVK